MNIAVNNLNFYSNLNLSKNLMFKNRNVNSRDNVSFLGQNKFRAEIIDFIDNPSNEPISSGLKGVVYKYKKGEKTYAIKVAKQKDYSFSAEADVLKQVPSDIDCQKYVDYFQHPKTGHDILVSNFVEGKRGVLENREDFENLFNKLICLDEAGVLHGDLNMQNCLFNNDGNISLIDFGEGETFNIGDTYNDFIYPFFVVKSNVVNLEHNGIPDCIKQWAHSDVDIKKCFKDYLSVKGEYYKRHAEILKAHDVDNDSAIDYEENCAAVLKNPSDLIIENEIRRIDCLYTFEQADTAVNYRQKPKATKRNWSLAIKKAKAQLEFIDEVLKRKDLDSKERKYFEYQKGIISMFNQQFNSWSNSTINWLDGLKYRNDLSNFEKKLIRNKHKSMTLPPDLVRIVLK